MNQTPSDQHRGRRSHARSFDVFSNQHPFSTSIDQGLGIDLEGTGAAAGNIEREQATSGSVQHQSTITMSYLDRVALENASVFLTPTQSPTVALSEATLTGVFTSQPSEKSNAEVNDDLILPRDDNHNICESDSSSTSLSKRRSATVIGRSSKRVRKSNLSNNSSIHRSTSLDNTSSCIHLLHSLSLSDVQQHPKQESFKQVHFPPFILPTESPLHHRSVRPPINTETLFELELSQILKNGQLLHDIVLDTNLQFRPNNHGERSARKRASTAKYWRSVSKELERLSKYRPVSFGALNLHSSNSKLSVLFTEVRNILLTLIPSEDRDTIYAMLDPSLICQQLALSALDLKYWGMLLGNTLKRHCAPMRDAAVEEMTLLLQSTSIVDNVNGLSKLFDILEVMKLVSC